jgi:hypothetical protein
MDFCANETLRFGRRHRLISSIRRRPQTRSHTLVRCQNCRCGDIAPGRCATVARRLDCQDLGSPFAVLPGTYTI